MPKDPYTILELHPGASQIEIEQAYQQLRARYTPQAGDSPVMKQIAYERLAELDEAYRLLMGQGSSPWVEPMPGQTNRTKQQNPGNPYRSPFEQGQQGQQAAFNRSICGGGPTCGDVACTICTYELCCDNGCCCC